MWFLSLLCSFTPLKYVFVWGSLPTNCLKFLLKRYYIPYLIMIEILLAGLFLYYIQWELLCFCIGGVCSNGCHNPLLKLWRKLAINHNVFSVVPIEWVFFIYLEAVMLSFNSTRERGEKPFKWVLMCFFLNNDELFHFIFKAQRYRSSLAISFLVGSYNQSSTTGIWASAVILVFKHNRKKENTFPIFYT